jgi:hypothetical protein
MDGSGRFITSIVLAFYSVYQMRNLWHVIWWCYCFIFHTSTQRFYQLNPMLGSDSKWDEGDSFFKGSDNLLQTHNITPLEHLHNCIGVSLDLCEAMHHGDIPYRVLDTSLEHPSTKQKNKRRYKRRFGMPNWTKFRAFVFLHSRVLREFAQVLHEIYCHPLIYYPTCVT